jgi:hypothetical protein
LEGGGYRERVKEGEYGGNIRHSRYANGKMRPVETIQGE